MATSTMLIQHGYIKMALFWIVRTEGQRFIGFLFELQTDEWNATSGKETRFAISDVQTLKRKLSGLQGEIRTISGSS